MQTAARKFTALRRSGSRRVGSPSGGRTCARWRCGCDRGMARSSSSTSYLPWRDVWHRATPLDLLTDRISVVALVGAQDVAVRKPFEQHLSSGAVCYLFASEHEGKRATTRALPRVSVGRCGLIFENCAFVSQNWSRLIYASFSEAVNHATTFVPTLLWVRTLSLGCWATARPLVV